MAIRPAQFQWSLQARSLTIALHRDELQVATEILCVQPRYRQTVTVSRQRRLEVGAAELVAYFLRLSRREGVVPDLRDLLPRDASALITITAVGGVERAISLYRLHSET